MGKDSRRNGDVWPKGLLGYKLGVLIYFACVLAMLYMDINGGYLWVTQLGMQRWRMMYDLKACRDMNMVC